jgi:hypothetical protein
MDGLQPGQGRIEKKKNKIGCSLIPHRHRHVMVTECFPSEMESKAKLSILMTLFNIVLEDQQSGKASKQKTYKGRNKIISFTHKIIVYADNPMEPTKKSS